MTISAEPFDRGGSGVRVSGETLHTYDLTVVAADAASVVASAGGWLCDRARAGWQVVVKVPAGHDTRALTILGVRHEAVESAVEALRGLSTAAVAVDARILRHDERVQREVLQLVDGKRAEVTVWGESALFGSDGRFERVRHRLSAAARAFKAHALATTDQAAVDPAAEEFLGAALWYPPDGADLVPGGGAVDGVAAVQSCRPLTRRSAPAGVPGRRHGVLGRDRGRGGRRLPVRPGACGLGGERAARRAV